MGNRTIASRTKADGKKDEEEARGNDTKLSARIMKVMDASSHDVAFNFNRLLVGRFQIQMLSAKELRDYNVGIGISPPTVSHILKSKPTWINGSETL